jgi:hypothetical protein
VPVIAAALLTQAESADCPPATLERAWTAGQQQLAQLLPDTPHLTATNSSHYVQIEQSQLVIDAIRQVVDAVRGGSRQLAR